MARNLQGAPPMNAPQTIQILDIFKDEPEAMKLGEFNVSGPGTLGGALRLTDPCYERDTWCATSVGDAVPGKWVGYARHTPDTWTPTHVPGMPSHPRMGSPMRVARVIACHEDNIDREDHRWETVDADIGVDSGQAGIFDDARYTGRDDDDTPGGFYDRACTVTLGYSFIDGDGDPPVGHPHAGVIDEGVVASSGYGDGGYIAEVSRDRFGRVIAARITFISDPYPEWAAQHDDEETE